MLAVRLLEDYLVMPRLLGNAVGLSPLVILTAVSAAGILLGGFAVLLAIPLAALLMTLVDVLVLNKDPAPGGRPDRHLPGQGGVAHRPDPAYRPVESGEGCTVSDLSWRPLRPHGSRPRTLGGRAATARKSGAELLARAYAAQELAHPSRPAGAAVERRRGRAGAVAHGGYELEQRVERCRLRLPVELAARPFARHQWHAERLGPKVSEIAAKLGIGEDEAAECGSEPVSTSCQRCAFAARIKSDERRS